MRFFVRCRDEKTKRYRTVAKFDGMTYLRDSEHLHEQIFGVPVVIDSIYADGSEVWLTVTPSWNRKRPKSEIAPA